MNDNNWRRIESRSYEALFERVLGWAVVLVLVAVVAGCAFDRQPLGSAGAAFLLGRFADRTRGSDA